MTRVIIIMLWNKCSIILFFFTVHNINHVLRKLTTCLIYIRNIYDLSDGTASSIIEQNYFHNSPLIRYWAMIWDGPSNSGKVYYGHCNMCIMIFSRQMSIMCETKYDFFSNCFLYFCMYLKYTFILIYHGSSFFT